MNIAAKKPKGSGTADHYAGDMILQTLRAQILSGKLLPGQRIHQGELAKSFHVSRTPIHEVLLRLHEEELVRLVPNGTVTVVVLTSEDIEEILGIMASLEITASRTAACKVGEREKSELREIAGELDAAVNKQDSLLSFRAGYRLHDMIFAVAGNKRAQRIFRRLSGQLQRNLFIAEQGSGMLTLISNEQKAIIDVLLSGDPNETEITMRRHLSVVRSLLLQSNAMNEKLNQLLSNLKST